MSFISKPPMEGWGWQRRHCPNETSSPGFLPLSTPWVPTPGSTRGTKLVHLILDPGSTCLPPSRPHEPRTCVPCPSKTSQVERSLGQPLGQQGVPASNSAPHSLSVSAVQASLPDMVDLKMALHEQRGKMQTQEVVQAGALAQSFTRLPLRLGIWVHTPQWTCPHSHKWCQQLRPAMRTPGRSKLRRPRPAVSSYV